MKESGKNLRRLLQKAMKQDNTFNGRKAKTYLGSITMMEQMSAEEMKQLQAMHY